MSERSPRFRVHHDDCLNFAFHEGSRLYDLIYLDPPADFDLERDLFPRIQALVPRLSPEGFLLIHASGERHYEIKKRVDPLGLAFKGDVIWSFRQRAVKTKALQNQHQTILVYSDNSFYFPKRLVVAESVVGPSSGERTRADLGLDGQKPIKLYRRLLRLFEPYGAIENVLDPMAGSGALLAAALELGKDVIGFETSGACCEVIRKRLEESMPAALQLEMELE